MDLCCFYCSLCLLLMYINYVAWSFFGNFIFPINRKAFVFSQGNIVQLKNQQNRHFTVKWLKYKCFCWIVEMKVQENECTKYQIKQLLMW